LETLDCKLACDACLDAWAAAEIVGRDGGHADVVRRASAALGSTDSSRAFDLLLDGLATLLNEEAIERLGGTRLALELARAHLLYGEWLRRERRLVDVRDQLRRAKYMFTSMGAEAFAPRAGRELLANG